MQSFSNSNTFFSDYPAQTEHFQRLRAKRHVLQTKASKSYYYGRLHEDAFDKAELLVQVFCLLSLFRFIYELESAD